MHTGDLERRVGWALTRLPAVRAPDTFLPRVMATVHAWALRPWYERAWFTWPIGWQAASIAAVVLFGVGAALSLPGVEAVLQRGMSTLAARVAIDVPDISARLTATMLAARILWRALVHPILVYAFAIVVLMSVACATVAVALNRAVFGRALNS